jgi:hypothetical protein
LAAFTIASTLNWVMSVFPAIIRFLLSIAEISLRF